MELTVTSRGFGYLSFKDRHGYDCSLQKSSLATDDAIWFGIDKPEIKTFPPWTEFPLPENAHVFSRMELTREQVAELLPYLQNFVETGELGDTFNRQPNPNPLAGAK